MALHLYEQLIDILNAQKQPSATLEDFKRIKTSFGVSVPPELRALYQCSNGFVSQRLNFLSTQIAASHGGDFPILGALPLTDTYDSNPYCVCCNEPLRGRIALIRHDDESLIAFRSLETFLRAVIALVQQPGWQIEDLRHDYRNDGSNRDEQDVRAGRDLMESLHDSEAMQTETARLAALAWAFTLVSSESVQLIASFLEDVDPFVARAALDRLYGLDDAGARAAITRYEQELAEFKAKLISAIIKRGYQALDVHPGVVTVQPGPVHIDVAFLFSERNQVSKIDAALDRLLKR